MALEEAPPDQSDEIPEGATVIRQVQYAWLWSSAPWLIILAVVYYTDFLIEAVPVVGAIITVIILAPRYVAWRRTAYILTDDSLIYKRGGITGSQKYQIPWSNLKGARANYGSFGRALGFQTVELLLQNDKVARLPYIPILQDVAGQIQELVDAADTGTEPDDEDPSKEPGKHDPDVTQYDPDAPGDAAPDDSR